METYLSYQRGKRHHGMYLSLSVRGKATFCIFLPEQETSLHVSVSARGIVLEDAHFVPLLAASVFLSLNNDISFRALKNI